MARGWNPWGLKTYSNLTVSNELHNPNHLATLIPRTESLQIYFCWRLHHKYAKVHRFPFELQNFFRTSYRICLTFLRVFTVLSKDTSAPPEAAPSYTSLFLYGAILYLALFFFMLSLCNRRRGSFRVPKRNRRVQSKMFEQPL